MAPRRSGRTPKPTAKYAAFKAAPKRKQKTPVPTKALTTAVQRIVKGTQETKLVIQSPFITTPTASTALSTFIGFNGPISSTNEIYSLIPTLAQGTGDHQRIGNQIQPVSLTVRGICSLQSNSRTSQRCVVDIYFLTSKLIKAEINKNEILIDRLLNKGDGTNTDYNGTTLNAMLPINTSEFTLLKHKRIVLGKNQDSPNSYADTSEPQDAACSYAKPWSCRIPMPKKLTYQTDANTSPSTYLPFMVIGWNYGDNNGGSFGSTAGLFVQAQSHLYFKDA